VLEEVAAAVQSMSTVQKVAATRNISLEKAAVIVAEYEVLKLPVRNKQGGQQGGIAAQAAAAAAAGQAAASRRVGGGTAEAG
jgi:hypothetical protein